MKYLTTLIAFVIVFHSALENVAPKIAVANEPVASDVETAKPMNVLFIAIDDLRPELGCYGSEIAITPNMDSLAKSGLLFNRAYCQEAICCPSRASLMTGARPDTIRIVENWTKFRDINPDIVTLSQHFIANGYEAVQCGKIYHNRDHSDLEFSWNREPAFDKLSLDPPSSSYALPENHEIWKRNNERLENKYGKGIARTGLVQGPAYESADVADQAYRDGYNTDLAIATMKEIADEGKPFFIGLGYYKPHLDFIAPKRYWDLYDPADIPLATQADGPKDGAAMGLHASFELRVRDGIPKKGPIGPELARTLKHGYLACVSYVDAQIGRMIAALEESGLRENTIIIVWGDHGWHLGDMGVWGKATNYEIATRVPMMIWTPDMPSGTRGKKTDALVELVDIYPTLCELTGLSQPNHLEGTSFKPLIENPNRTWETAAFSQFPNPALREWAANPLQPSMRETFFGPLIVDVEKRIITQQESKWDREMFENHLMGYTMRTNRYRLVVWKDTQNQEAEPIDIELYDHEMDPHESVNIAKQKPKVVARLLKQFDKGWKGNRPPAESKKAESSPSTTVSDDNSPTVRKSETEPKMKLIFEDDFERSETQEETEEIGNGWGSNSNKRAGGNKQVDLREGEMHITMHPSADHAVSVTHPMEFQDGKVQMRFMLESDKDSLGLNFADLKCKQVHAGHLFVAKVNTKSVLLQDLKTGTMDLETRKMRLAKKLTADMQEELKTKRKWIRNPLKTKTWYTLEVEISGDTIQVSIDGNVVGEFKSDGIAHPTKRLLRLAVPNKAVVDYVKIYAN